MVPLTLRTLLPLSLLLATLPLMAPAAARDPCDSETHVATVGNYRVGAFNGDCVGLHVVRTNSFCLEVIWGVMTPFAGVGGHDTCDYRAYAAFRVTLP